MAGTIMRAGMLRHRLAIQVNTPTTNSYGERAQSWATADTRWGSVEPLGGGEPWNADQPNATQDFKVTIRYYSGLTTSHRFLYGSRALHILSIATGESVNRDMVCVCREMV